MRKRLAYLVNAYLLTWLIFSVAKIVFILCCGEGHDVHNSDYADILRHGCSLDVSTSLYILIVPFLAAVASLWVNMPRWLLRTYWIVVSFLLALAFIADTSLYPFWGFKLDASCLQYLSQPEGITQSVSIGYLLVRALLLAVVSLFFYFIYRLCLGDLPEKEPRMKRRVVASLVALLMTPLMVIGIRGGVDESTTNIGQVYYSQNQFLNHAAVNPVFSFLYSLTHQLGDLSEYDFFDAEECQALTDGVYTTESIGSDTLLNTTRPTIVLILLESAGEEFASVMPRLQQLKGEGISFTRCYANSWRTDRGTVCALSGYPSFPSVSVMKMPEKSRTLPSIASILRQQGYHTAYLYGGDINFTNMRSYLIASGWEHLTSMDDYSAADRHTAQWGVRDDITFATLYDQVTTTAAPALFGYSTLSSHEPWDVPLQRHDDEVLNAFAYLDDCLADFVGRLKQSEAWSDLLIVVTADHGINYRHIDQAHPLEKNHIPMLWLGGAIREPREIDVVCNQSDLAATLLAQLGLPHTDFSFSRDVLSATYTHPCAVHNYNNAQWMVDSTGHALYDFTARRFIVSECDDAEQLLKTSKAMLQLTTGDLRQR